MINFKDIDKIASLAKIDISEYEKESFKDHINNILDCVEILKEVDIDNEGLVDNIEVKAGILRKDDVVASLSRETILKNSHSTEDGYFIVPNILE